ncbi:MAG: hypothetical protein QOE35_526 [Actinomycetota bacterium]|jgi:hypothetical protein
MDGPGDIPALLRFLITGMDEDVEAGEAPVAPPALLRLDGADVACAVDGIDLHVKPLEGHPAEVLAGVTAPPEWFGIGVITGGWQHAPGVERVRVRIISFVCRDGTELAAVRTEGEDLRFMEGRGEGQVPDTLRRVLGLPTNPPDVSIAEWLAKCWLERILQRAKRGGRAPKLAWRDAAALHPAIAVVGARPDELATVAPRTATSMRWERFRRLQAAHGDALAAWMDDGMFARQMVHGRPPVDLLLRRASRRLTPDARARVEATLEEWGLLAAA